MSDNDIHFTQITSTQWGVDDVVIFGLDQDGAVWEYRGTCWVPLPMKRRAECTSF